MAPSQKYHRRLACAVCRLRQSAGEQAKTVAVLKRTWTLRPPCNLTGPGVRSQESGVSSQELGVRSQEPGARSQEPGARSQESGVRSQESGVRSQESGSELL